MDETCANRELVRGDVMERGVHDVIAEELARGVGGGGFKLEVYLLLISSCWREVACPLERRPDLPGQSQYR